MGGICRTPIDCDSKLLWAFGKGVAMTSLPRRPGDRAHLVCGTMAVVLQGAALIIQVIGLLG